MQKQLQTLKGFRDLLPAEKQKRDYVEKKIVEVFGRYGFVPLETPTLEYASLLLGKYGDEADKLVYTFKDRGEREIGLRYDQTVPTARILSQYSGQLPKFFRRYQIQNVFRSDKPQKGRYREFTQCDIDIFGTVSPIADAEILACTYDSFLSLGFKKIKIVINDRQILLQTLRAFATEQVSVYSIIQSLDKLDKLTQKEVETELIAKGLLAAKVSRVLETISQAKVSPQLSEIIASAKNLGVPEEALVFSPTLARGLDYYTGMIFEVQLTNITSSSLAGGGRYDQLIGQLSGSENVPAVGVAFGFDRIVELAESLKLIPPLNATAQALVTIFAKSSITQSLELAQKLRGQGISVEVYPQADKLGKQFKLADQKKIPFALILGEEEIKTNKISLKNMQTGKQELLSFDQVLIQLKKIN